MDSTSKSVDDRPGAGAEASFRYGAALILTVVLLVFLIAAPSARWAEGVAVAIEGGLLTVVAATSKESAKTRWRLTLSCGGATALVAVLAAVGVLPEAMVRVIAGLLTAVIFGVLLQGVAKLIGLQGVTAQAVAGALTIYLLIGLTFAWTIAVVVQISNTPYFVQVKTPTTSDIVYFSFTVLTTTGFGDLTAATRVGRALAVLEMVTGQIYLVTIVGVLIGHFVGRRGRQ
jgi:hypothetical protein